MLACPACRHANPVDAADCRRCGASLMGATLLGMSPPPVDEPDETNETGAAPMRTLFGQAPLASLTESAPAPAENPADRSRTLFGVPAPSARSGPAVAGAPARPLDASEDGPTLRRPAPREDRKRREPRPERSGAPEPHRPGATTLLHQEAAEILAAAKIAGAVADEERDAAQRRLRLTLWALLGVALVTALIGFMSYRNRHRFQAEVGGELRVQRDTGGYGVRVRLHTTAPALVQLPEAATGGPVEPVTGDAEVSFRLPDHALTVGDNHLALGVTPVDDPGERRTLTLQVRVYYRFVSTPAEAPRPGATFDLRMALMPGWKLTVPDARVSPQADGELLVALDTAVLLAAAERFSGPLGEYPLKLVLEGPAGESATFTEALRFPLPDTRLRLLQPLHASLIQKDSVEVEGLATPGAVVAAGGATVTADASGRFRISLPVPRPGRTDLEVEARTPGRTATRVTVSVERVTAATLAARRTEARRLADAVVTPAPAYASLLGAPPSAPGPPFRVQGRVLAVRRGETPGLDEVELATCAAGCPYWITASQPVFATTGQSAVVVGRWVGQHTFQTREGQSVIAPRLEALAILARP